MTRLYTFAISHFSEKARWALDLAGIDYEERLLLPGPHMATIRAIAPRSSVPVLVHGGRVVQGSSAILDYVQTSFGVTELGLSDPDSLKRALDFESRADRVFGLGVQRIAYSVLLNHRKVVTDLWCQKGPFWGRAFYAVAYPGVARAVRRMYRIEPAVVDESKVRFAELIEELDRRLESQPYLDGEAPGRADITVAALLAPLCRPPEHLLDVPALPDELSRFVSRFEDGPTFRHVLEMYRQYRRRGPRAAQAENATRDAGRTRAP